MKVTLKDIARECAVSVGAVSDILKEKGNFKEETRSRVLAAVRRLNYRGAGIEAEAEAITRMVGLVLPASDIDEDTFYHRGVSGVKAAAVKNGYNVSLYTEEEIISILEGKRTAGPAVLPGGGLIILAPFKDWEPYLPELQKRGVPVVMAFRKTEVAGVPVVCQDMRQGFLLGLEHVHGLGHRTIGLIRRVPRTDAGQSLDAYREFLAAHELPYREDLVADVMKHTGDSFNTWLDGIMQDANRPTAFICEADDLAMGMIRLLHKRDIRVPEDAAVVGFGDTPAARQYVPSITSIGNPAREVAGLAMDLLVQGQTNGPETKYNITDSTVRYTLECSLTVRESCGSGAGEKERGGIV